jgi:hypothetical protein
MFMSVRFEFAEIIHARFCDGHICLGRSRKTFRYHIKHSGAYYDLPHWKMNIKGKDNNKISRGRTVGFTCVGQGCDWSWNGAFRITLPRI